MATSGSTNFELDVADYIEEAFERCGMESRTGYDLKTAKRSLNLVLADWANRGLNRWTIAQTTTSISSGTASYSLGADTIDVLGVIIRTGSGTTQSDQVLTRLSRDAYLTIPNKNTQAKPSPFRFYPCLSAGLAYYLALKKAPERVALLKTVYEEEFKRAADEDRDRASLKLTPSRDYYTRS